jgi:hypothetical protein
MFAFAFEGVLFAFAFRRPAFAPLFALPDTRRHRQLPAYISFFRFIVFPHEAEPRRTHTHSKARRTHTQAEDQHTHH